MYCSNCGKQISDNANFCPQCGNSINQAGNNKENKPEQVQRDKSRNRFTIGVSAAIITGAVLLIMIAAVIKNLIPAKTTPVTTEYAETSTAAPETITETAAAEPSESEQVPQTSAANGSGSISSEEYILPESNSRYYTKAEISTLSEAELRLARNEIYARHGRIFQAEDLHTYFSAKSWYVPLYQPEEFTQKGDGIFNEYERSNQKLIVEAENDIQKAALPADTAVVDAMKKFPTDEFHILIEDPLNYQDKGGYYEVNAVLTADVMFTAQEMEQKKPGDTIKVLDDWYQVVEVSTSDFNTHYRFYELNSSTGGYLGIVTADDSGMYHAVVENDIPVQTTVYRGKIRMTKDAVAVFYLDYGNAGQKTTLSAPEFLSNELERMPDIIHAWYYATLNSNGYIIRLEEHWTP